MQTDVATPATGGSCPPAGAVLSAATWNIHGGVGGDGRYAPTRIFDVLSEAYEASRVTIRRALESLRAEGLVESRQGYGWIAAEGGGNPYVDPPSAFPESPAAPYLGADWRDTTTVYGPVFTGLSEPVARVAGSSSDAAAWLSGSVPDCPYVNFSGWPVRGS